MAKRPFFGGRPVPSLAADRANSAFTRVSDQPLPHSVLPFESTLGCIDRGGFGLAETRVGLSHLRGELVLFVFWESRFHCCAFGKMHRDQRPHRGPRKTGRRKLPGCVVETSCFA